MSINQKYNIISLQYSLQEVLDKYVKKGQVIKYSMIYSPIFLIKVNITTRFFMKKVNKTGTWVFDAVNQSVNICPETLQTEVSELNDDIILESSVTVEEAELLAKNATLANKFKYLQNPEFNDIDVIEEMYQPYYMILWKHKKKEKIYLIDAVTGEENLLMRERMNIPIHLK